MRIWICHRNLILFLRNQTTNQALQMTHISRERQIDEKKKWQTKCSVTYLNEIMEFQHANWCSNPSRDIESESE